MGENCLFGLLLSSLRGREVPPERKRKVINAMTVKTKQRTENVVGNLSFFQW